MTQAPKNDAPQVNWPGCQFLTSAARLADLPVGGVEVAFAGRSNAGKSSALNTLTGRNALARTSKTPGRTQLINLFELAPGSRLADLPGYGFAKVPAEVQRRWTALVEAYFRVREPLVGVIVIVDIRRGLTDLDKQLLGWLAPSDRAAHLLVTKSDKLSRGAARTAIDAIRKALWTQFPGATAQLFSAKTREGVDEARARISSWLEWQ